MAMVDLYNALNASPVTTFNCRTTISGT